VPSHVRPELPAGKGVELCEQPIVFSDETLVGGVVEALRVIMADLMLHPLAGLGHRVGRGRGADDYALRAVVAAGSAACEHVLEPRPRVSRLAEAVE
jgi:hypothetical protein